MLCNVFVHFCVLSPRMLIVCSCRTLINYLTTVAFFEKWAHVWFYSPILPSPSSLPMLPLPSSGDGDQEHALPGHRVRQERGDLWWVTPPAKPGLSIFKHTVTPSLSTSPPTSAHEKNVMLVCVNGVFDKQGSIKVLLSLHCSYTYTALISKVTWLMDIWEQWPYMAPVMCSW